MNIHKSNQANDKYQGSTNYQTNKRYQSNNYLTTNKDNNNNKNDNYQEHNNSDDDLNEQINDKLSQLWTSMRNKKLLLIKNLTPSYSRTSSRNLSQLNNTHTNLTNQNLTNQNIVHNNINNRQQTNSNLNNTYLCIQKMNNKDSDQNIMIQNKLMRMRQKLVSQQSNRKSKQSQIERLKNRINQLCNDKKILINQIKQCNNISVSKSNIKNQFNYNQNNNQNTNKNKKQNNNNNQLDINNQDDLVDYNVDGKTANFNPKNINNNKKSTQIIFNNHQNHKNNHNNNHKNNLNNKNNYHSKSKKNNNINKSYQTQSSNKQNHSSLNNKHIITKQSSIKQSQIHNNLQDISKTRLIELLRSTSQYRQFAYYYDSHQLSYLKRIQQQHKKNSTFNYSSIQKKLWAPQSLYQQIKLSNIKNKWQLSQTQLQQVISQMKTYFEINSQLKIKQTKQHYLKKFYKLKRQQQNNIPYDLVRLSNARQRDLCKKRNKSIKY